MKMAKKEKYIQPCVIRAPPGTPREAMVFTATTHGGYTQFKNIIFSPIQLNIQLFWCLLLTYYFYYLSKKSNIKILHFSSVWTKAWVAQLTLQEVCII